MNTLGGSIIQTFGTDALERIILYSLGKKVLAKCSLIRILRSDLINNKFKKKKMSNYYYF